MKYPFLFLCTILLLTGAGCGNDAPDSNKNTPDEQTVVSTTIAQQAYLFCTQKGYEIEIRFVPETQKNVAFCVFGEEKECESVAFLQGQCTDETADNATTTPSTISMFEPSLNDPHPLRLCEPKADPICGVDGKTYTNACVASFLKIEMAHEGPCETSRTEEAPTLPAKQPPIPDINPKEPNKISPSTISESFAREPKKDEWVEIPSSLLKSSTDNNSRIERCTYNQSTTFLVTTDCPECFSTLYDATGEVLCYPGHDITGSCPAYVESGAYKNTCKKLNP